MRILCKNSRELIRAFEDNYEPGHGVFVRDEANLLLFGWAIVNPGDKDDVSEIRIQRSTLKAGRFFPYTDMLSTYEGRWEFARMIRECLTTCNGMTVDLSGDLERHLEAEGVNLKEDPYSEDIEGRWDEIV